MTQDEYRFRALELTAKKLALAFEAQSKLFAATLKAEEALRADMMRLTERLEKLEKVEHACPGATVSRPRY
jgi:hypothetical protein